MLAKPIFSSQIRPQSTPPEEKPKWSPEAPATTTQQRAITPNPLPIHSFDFDIRTEEHLEIATEIFIYSLEMNRYQEFLGNLSLMNKNYPVKYFPLQKIISRLTEDNIIHWIANYLVKCILNMSDYSKIFVDEIYTTTPLEWARINNKEWAIKLLVEHGCK
jgi:hypothetical protein